MQAFLGKNQLLKFLKQPTQIVRNAPKCLQYLIFQKLKLAMQKHRNPKDCWYILKQLFVKKKSFQENSYFLVFVAEIEKQRRSTKTKSTMCQSNFYRVAWQQLLSFRESQTVTEQIKIDTPFSMQLAGHYFVIIASWRLTRKRNYESDLIRQHPN